MNLKLTYNKIAEDWVQDHASDTWWIEGTEKFCKLLFPGAAILDVGCGAGVKAYVLAEKGFKVKGVDFSEKMIEVARSNYPDLDFEVMDMYHLEHVNNIFDAVFAQASVLHIPKKDVLKILQKMKNQLNQNGLLYLAVKEKKEHQAEEEIKKESDYGYVYERFFSYFNMPELKDYLTKLDMQLIWDRSSQTGNTTWLQVIAKKT